MFLLLLATMMLPAQVTIVPLFVMFTRLHWVGSSKPLIVPAFFGDAFSIFLLSQFFLTIPQELVDAAKVDGANEFQIMWHIVVKLAKPAIMAVGLVPVPLLLERLLRAARLRGQQRQRSTRYRSDCRSSPPPARRAVERPDGGLA